MTACSVVKVIWYNGFKDDVKRINHFSQDAQVLNKRIRKRKELSAGYPGLPRNGCSKWYHVECHWSKLAKFKAVKTKSFIQPCCVFIRKTSALPSWTRYRTYVSSQKWYSLDERRETQHVSWFSRWLIVTACRVTASECNNRLPWVVDLHNISTFQL